MRRQWLSRTIEMLATLWLVITLCFFMLRLLPAGPFDDELALEPEIKSQIESYYLLDQPLWKQYLNYISNIAQGDLGESYLYNGQSISGILSETLPASLQLGGMALVLSILGGILCGLVAAHYHKGKLGAISTLVFSAGISLPNIVTAPLLILFFSFYLDLLPAGLWEGVEFYVLPVLALSIRPICLIARLIQAQAIEILNMNFVRVARANGLPKRLIFIKHVLPNSVLPVLGIMGLMTAGILSGSFVIELIFSIPGAGANLLEGVSGRDYTLVMAMVIFYTFLLTFTHWLIDMLTFWIDPRLRSGSI